MLTIIMECRDNEAELAQTLSALVSGAVEGIVDLTGLLPEEDVTPATDVLNGIAYDAAGGRIFVTGKNWNKLFEIEIREK